MASAIRKPVLISGAGLASLLLARSLLRASIPFTVFERDSSISFRGQGYRLRLSTEGLDAIEAVLSPEGFKKFWDRCGKTGGVQGLGVVDAISGENVPSDGPAQPPSKATESSEKAQSESSAPSSGPKAMTGERLVSRDGKTVGISRGDMRALFLEGCEDHIRWGHQVVSYEETADGVRAIFKDGSKSEEGSLLVGGEGIYSKVAKQVSDGALKVYDTGATGIHGQAPTTAFKGLGEGVWRVRDDRDPEKRVSIITNVRPNDIDDPTVEFGWTMVGRPGVIQPPGNNYQLIGKPAADIARSLTADWHPRVRSLIDNIVETEAAFWKITCSTPSGVPVWKNHPRVTVIGDAAHSMTPAGGIGANTAVRDSALLGKLLTEAGGWREGITEDYEKVMRVYASEAVGISYGTATGQFGVNIVEGVTPTVG